MSRKKSVRFQPRRGCDVCYVSTVMAPDPSLSERFEMRATEAWLAAVDDWRRTQPDLPSRGEAIRRLVEQARKKPAAAMRSRWGNSGPGSISMTAMALPGCARPEFNNTAQTVFPELSRAPQRAH